MKNINENNLAKGIIAAGVGLTGVALRELLLSKEEHDKKEREINKVEKTKEKYMKKIGSYEPFDIKKGGVTPDDSKLVNLLTRAVGVGFTNNDVFARNKSNIRTFPFIISNNSSISATIEVELRKYYEVMVAAQVANLINHTVFAAENILNIKDDTKRSVDKVIDQILDRQSDMIDVGNSLQKGIYENVLFEQDGKIISLNENYTNSYPTLDQYINDFQRIIKTHVTNAGQKNTLIKQMQDITETNAGIIAMRRNFKHQDFTLNPGETLTPQEQLIERNIKDLFNGNLARPFDQLEDEEVAKDIRTNSLVGFNAMMHKYVKGKDIVSNVTEYLEELRKYYILLSRGVTIINNNNFTEPNKELANSDPYFRLLDLPRVDNYDDSSQMAMKMFRNSNTLQVKLEMAAALLISTEILPFEFIEYATKYLGLPMHDKTKLSIQMKYGMGTKTSPFRFMGASYIMDNKDSVLNFYQAMKPNEVSDLEALSKKLTNKQLKANKFALGFFSILRKRKKLEKQWVDKNKGKIENTLASVYASSAKLDNIRKHRSIERQILSQSEKMHSGRDKAIDKIVNTSNTDDMMYGKSLSMLGAGGSRVHRIIEDRLKNKIIDLYSVKDVDKSLNYFLNDNPQDKDFNPTSTFMPNLDQTQRLMRTVWAEGIEDKVDITILTEDLILSLTEKVLEESYVHSISQPTRTVTYKEVTKDPIEYMLPAYTKGRSLLYGATEIDPDQFKTRKVGEPIWIKVTFSDKINSMKSDVTDNDFSTVIGIKSEVKRVKEEDAAKVLKSPNNSSSELTSIFKDQKNQTLGLLSKIANENELNSASLNGILVVSVNEATSNIASKASDDYINNPKLAIALRKTYNLTSICLVDSIAEEYFIMEENSRSWSRLPFSELRASGSNSDLKAIASIIGRG